MVLARFLAWSPERFYDVCLVDVLRAHGFKVEYTWNGPFWAMKDRSGFRRCLATNVLDYRKCVISFCGRSGGKFCQWTWR